VPDASSSLTEFRINGVKNNLLSILDEKYDPTLVEYKIKIKAKENDSLTDKVVLYYNYK
jgi:hypothetical protein